MGTFYMNYQGLQYATTLEHFPAQGDNVRIRNAFGISEQKTERKEKKEERCGNWRPCAKIKVGSQAAIASST
jgi:hypothetical protein